MGITHAKNGVIRVALTIREDTRTAWFCFLQTVSSGQARAELLRTHLGPSPEHFRIHPHCNEEGGHDFSPEQGVTANSYNFSTGIPRTFDVPEKFSGAQTVAAEQAGNLPPKDPVTANSYNFSAGIPRTFDMPENFSGSQTIEFITDCDENSESSAGLLVKTRPGGL